MACAKRSHCRECDSSSSLSLSTVDTDQRLGEKPTFRSCELFAFLWENLLRAYQSSRHHGKFEVYTAATMKNAVLLYVKTLFVPHRKHNLSRTDPSRLTLCKIWGFHGDDYEECRLLDIRTQFVLHRNHITSPLQCPAS
jgi:hypothetical protein